MFVELTFVVCSLRTEMDRLVKTELGDTPLSLHKLANADIPPALHDFGSVVSPEAMLLANYAENRKAGEKAALDFITATDVPVATFLRDLTFSRMSRCLASLKKSTLLQDEQALFQTLMLDFIACALQCGNFLPIYENCSARTKQGHLGKLVWEMIFLLRNHSMTLAQLQSVQKVIEAAVSRLPDSLRRECWEVQRLQQLLSHKLSSLKANSVQKEKFPVYDFEDDFVPSRPDDLSPDSACYSGTRSSLDYCSAFSARNKPSFPFSAPSESSDTMSTPPKLSGDLSTPSKSSLGSLLSPKSSVGFRSSSKSSPLNVSTSSCASSLQLSPHLSSSSHFSSSTGAPYSRNGWEQKSISGGSVPVKRNIMKPIENKSPHSLAKYKTNTTSWDTERYEKLQSSPNKFWKSPSKCHKKSPVQLGDGYWTSPNKVHKTTTNSWDTERYEKVQSSPNKLWKSPSKCHKKSSVQLGDGYWTSPNKVRKTTTTSWDRERYEKVQSSPNKFWKSPSKCHKKSSVQVSDGYCTSPNKVRSQENISELLPWQVKGSKTPESSETGKKQMLGSRWSGSGLESHKRKYHDIGYLSVPSANTKVLYTPETKGPYTKGTHPVEGRTKAHGSHTSMNSGISEMEINSTSCRTGPLKAKSPKDAFQVLLDSQKKLAELRVQERERLIIQKHQK